MAHQITSEGGTAGTPAAGHVLVAEAGVAGTPDAGHVLVAEAGVAGSPAAGHVLVAEAGVAGSPAAGHVLVAEAGVAGTPAAGPVLVAEAGVAGSPTAPGVIRPEGGSTGGGLTFATASLQVLGDAADGAVEILGYSYGTEQTTPLPGKTLAESYAIALAAAINADVSEGGIRPTAVVSGSRVDLTAGIPGVLGNEINLISSDANVVPSGAYLSGGAGDVAISITGTLTKNGSTAVVFPTLYRDQLRASSMPEYSSNAGDYDIGGPAFTGWFYTLQITGVFTGTFPSLILAGYKWTAAATRYVANVFAEKAEWESALQATPHAVEDATGWAPVSPATGVPVIGDPSGSTIPAPAALIGEGGTAGSPAAPPALVAESSY
jgi:hypothetical protein